MFFNEETDRIEKQETVVETKVSLNHSTILHSSRY